MTTENNGPAPLVNGQKLQAIYFAQPTNGEEYLPTFVGSNGVKSITVLLESGPHCGLPWAEVLHNDGRVFRYNLLNVEGVQLAGEVAE